MLSFIPVEDMHIENKESLVSYMHSGFPLIILVPKYAKWVKKYRNIHKYHEPLFCAKNFRKAMDERNKKRFQDQKIGHAKQNDKERSYGQK